MPRTMTIPDPIQLDGVDRPFTFFDFWREMICDHPEQFGATGPEGLRMSQRLLERVERAGVGDAVVLDEAEYKRACAALGRPHVPLRPNVGRQLLPYFDAVTGAEEVA